MLHMGTHLPLLTSSHLRQVVAQFDSALSLLKHMPGMHCVPLSIVSATSISGYKHSKSFGSLQASA